MSTSISKWSVGVCGGCVNCVSTVCAFSWPEEEEVMKCVCHCEALVEETPGVYVTRKPSPFKAFLEDIETEISMNVLDETGENTTIASQDWLVFLQLASSIELLDIINSSKSAPLIGIAALVSDSQSPSPISEVETGLGVHLHANFCLTDNRRDLWLHDYDTEGRARVWTQWNKLLLYKFLPPLLVSLLSHIHDENLLYACWPYPAAVPPRYKPFLTAFTAAVMVRVCVRGV
eukprot:Blabericola_migrator_1__5677@NODE_2884_length_2246_cov_15_047728_g1809_i0_p1_GENE_NODE_2884_length_2246_cov_15_047728_g1809_i0NODE_2884_length_2246_cov_15_047728_g1809_i0_p1_ORF_typecomplete_len232_score60_07_NODE_2884_length_2246_cov_15_047728_g1809_i04521147